MNLFSLDRRYFLIVTLVLALFVVAACGSPPPEETPTAEPTVPVVATSPPPATTAPTNTPQPTNTPRPTATPAPTNTPAPTPRPTIDLSAQGGNLPPHVLIGSASINGSLAPRNTLVLAFVGDTEVGGGIVGGDGKYSPMQVAAPGQLVTFTIGGFVADQTIDAEIGGATVLNLTASSP